MFRYTASEQFEVVHREELYMEKYMNPSKDEIVMAFVASYIYPYYEQLHSESRENLTESLIDTLLRWESDK